MLGGTGWGLHSWQPQLVAKDGVNLTWLASFALCYNDPMGEREPRKETIGKGELFFLWHPGTEEIFSAYGLTMRPGS